MSKEFVNELILEYKELSKSNKNPYRLNKVKELLTHYINTSFVIVQFQKPVLSLSDIISIDDILSSKFGTIQDITEDHIDFGTIKYQILFNEL